MLKNHPSDTDGKVYSQEEVRLFEFSNVLGKLISDVYDYSSPHLKFRNPVPIKDDRKKVIGFGNIYLEGDCLKVQCNIGMDCPERLDIENGLKLYLHPIGLLAFEDEPAISFGIDFAGRKKKVKDIIIFSLSLTNGKPKNAQPAISKSW